MTVDSLLEREELFFATGTVAAHAQQIANGFRQRDVKFFIELFSNWLEVSRGTRILEVKNTQIGRYLIELSREGYARRLSRRGHPTYRLTRIGLIELVSRSVNRSYIHKKDEFFFLYTFIKTYKPQLEELVQAEGKQFPYALKEELTSLLDEDAFVAREIKAAKEELSRHQNRLDNLRRAGRMVKTLLQKDTPEDEITNQLEKRFPYALNSQKPLHELMSTFPQKFRRHDFEHGYERRAEDLFHPLEKLLESYISMLQTLKTT